MEPITIALLIFLLTFLLILTELVHKTLAALLGAFLMITYGLVQYTEIGSFIDPRALGVIFGMMIVVEVVKDSGIFHFFGIKTVKLTKGDGKKLFVGLLVLTTFLSAFLSNIASILIISALTFTLCRSLEIDPIPLIMCEAIITNIGGLMFLTSSTPNVLIAGATGFNFINFLTFTFPLAFILMVATIGFFLVVFKKYLKGMKKIDVDNLDEWSVVPNKPFFWKSLIILVMTIFFFMIYDKIGVTMDFVAISSAIIILLLSGADPDKTLKDIEWGTIFFFIGLFVVVGGLEKSGFLEIVAHKMIELIGGQKVVGIPLVVWMSGITSGIVDNIPITVTLIPIVRSLVESLGMNVMWWCLAIGAGLGGNLTPLGSPSSVIAMGISKKEGNPIPFGKFLKLGLITTLIHLFIGTLYLLFRFFVF